MSIEVHDLDGEMTRVPTPGDKEVLVVGVPNDMTPVQIGSNGPEVVQDEKRETTKPRKDNRDDLDEI